MKFASYSIALGVALTAFLVIGDPGMKNNESPSRTELATLGAGCFWCVEAVFQSTPGVVSVKSGYSGGRVDNPTYEQVCSGNSGHAEVIQVEFDPDKVGFADLLELFWRSHDPTQVNRQGADVGTQYRSAIFYHSEEQRKIAERSKQTANASGDFKKPIATEIAKFEKFYEAEKYHQDYYKNNPNAAYCTFVIRPKLKKLGIE